jgi:hypothetical protein
MQVQGAIHMLALMLMALYSFHGSASRMSLKLLAAMQALCAFHMQALMPVAATEVQAECR